MKFTDILILCLINEDATNNDDNTYEGYCMKLTEIRNAKTEGCLMKLLFAIYPSFSEPI